MKRLLIVATAVLMMATLSFGQKKGKEDSTTRSVEGVITDASDKIVGGAVVQLKDSKTLQVRSFITKEDGMYHFHGLSPEVDYELKADHEGATSGGKTLSAFDNRKSAVINMRLGAKK
ncbi:MAG TPA: carboxypeptidase-like regulatory domain-containing protein [Bryobacteraceae bacterium]|nr:carboxypeptidase-like regulatory domain-containing protein [Bryobacteraceae bacterium]